MEQVIRFYQSYQKQNDYYSKLVKEYMNEEVLYQEKIKKFNNIVKSKDRIIENQNHLNLYNEEIINKKTVEITRQKKMKYIFKGSTGIGLIVILILAL